MPGGVTDRTRAPDAPQRDSPAEAPARREPAERSRQPTPTVSFLLRLPDVLYRELDAVAQRDQTTMTAVIARALQVAGFNVPPSALDDRRRRRRVSGTR